MDNGSPPTAAPPREIINPTTEKLGPIPMRVEPITKVNGGLADLHAGKVSGRIVYLHAAQSGPTRSAKNVPTASVAV
jgi:hypothetical protein